MTPIKKLVYRVKSFTFYFMFGFDIFRLTTFWTLFFPDRLIFNSQLVLQAYAVVSLKGIMPISSNDPLPIYMGM